MDLIAHLRRSLVEKASRYGLLLTSEALDYVLFHVSNPDTLFSSLSRSGLTLVRLEDITGETLTELEKKAEENMQEDRVVDIGDTIKETCRISIRVKLIVEDEEPSSWERDRERIIIRRLEVLRDMIRLREGSVSYERALRSQEERVIVGVVLEKNRNTLYIENGEEVATVYVSTSKLEYIDRDCVVGIRVKGNGERLFGSDIVFPGPGNVRKAACSFRLLIVPPGAKPPDTEMDGIVYLGPLVDVVKEPDPRKKYREWDKVFTSHDVPVFVVPGPQDAVRYVPPRPPIDEKLLPDSAASDNVFLLSSPSLVRINGADVLFYDGEYYKKRDIPPISSFLTLLIQQNISTFPYRSPKDYSLLKRAPTYMLLPFGASGEMGGKLIGSSGPFLLELSSGKVIRW